MNIYINMEKQPIRSILIPSRGEVACRLIKTAKKLGIKTIVLYGDLDKNSLYVENADIAVPLNGISLEETYLNIDKIIKIAKEYNVDAIHPGYGFLAENADFVEKLEKEKIRFIGPSSYSIRAIGSKIKAKSIAQKVNTPIVATYDKIVTDNQQALIAINKIGYPVLFKASDGGGGKGIRVVRNDNEIEEKLSQVKYESKILFKNENIFIEKYLENIRHIEIQIAADKYGNIVCLGDRDCSIQRKNQKIIEEAPSDFIDNNIRKKMYQNAINIIKECKYYSIGTLEFIIDKNKNFYFMEMNTRLQVEHGITEYITNIDLVELMIKIEEGEKLPFKQEDIKLNGHAIECRICAEKPSNNFIASQGTITHYIEPEKNNDNIRVDTGIQLGDKITPYFDSIISKLIVYGKTRYDAINIMKKKLAEYEIEGVENNISFLENVIRQDDFVKNNIFTNFIETHYKNGFNNQNIDSDITKIFIVSAVIHYLTNQKNLFSYNIASAITRDTSFYKLYVLVNNKTFFIEIKTFNDNNLSLSYNNKLLSFKYYYNYNILKITDIKDSAYFIVKCKKETQSSYTMQTSGETAICQVYTQDIFDYIKYMPNNIDNKEKDSKYLFSTMNGIISAMKIKIGDTVAIGQQLLSIDAMKMRNNILSERHGKIKNIFFANGDAVKEGDKIIEFE